MMRVLFVTHTLDMSGANRSMLQLIKELRANYGVEPYVVMPRIKMDTDCTLITECQANNIPHLVHKMTHFKRHEACGMVERLYFIVVHLLSTLHLLWKLRKESFDLVHSNASVMDVGAYISRWKHIPHVWHLREFGKEDFGLASCLGERYERWVYGKCEQFIAISNVIKNAFCRVVERQRMTVVYNGILPQKDGMDATHDENRGVVNITMVGRVEANKNQMEALEALRILKERGVTNVRLHVIGRVKEEAYLQRLEAFVKKHALQEMVCFMGVRQDVPLLNKDMDIGLMLSTSEAFGRVTIEFQLQNVAVIATNAGANAELIEDGQTGLLYTLGHPEELAQCLQRLIENRSDMLRMAAEGKRHAQEYFSSERNSREVYAVYQTVMQKKR